ncbi:hypothetical protein CPB83DRAFT_898959 [Crepidotus variabilis]|uniref:Uncharacterized protein n=1 Tax=Crepidotus variabilis TaxID=179855 RepID=A0A9P6JJS9_9AGAR|nr:hypothetical protein CPB83DRAFT_898959 [Crepidotus variabilis]
MDISPHHDSRPPTLLQDPASPTPQSATSSSPSHTQLAGLLADAYRENESLRKELASARRRAEKSERIVQILNSDPTPSPATTSGASATNGGGGGASVPHDIQQLQQKHTDTVKRLIDECDEQVRSAQSARDEADTRRRMAQDGWDQLERFLSELELRAKDARSAFSRLSSGSTSPGGFVLPGIPSPTALLSASTPSPSSAQYTGSAMGPPGAVPTRQSSRHASNRSGVFPVLPPHPNPNPTSTSHTTGTRRPRTPSVDAYAAGQPPAKRSRGSTDDQRGREPRTSYSESSTWIYLSVLFPSLVQQYLSGPPHPDYQDPHRARHLQRLPEARIIDRNYGSYQAHFQPGDVQHVRHNHSRSGSHSSTSSLDVDEMLLQATGGEEQGGIPNANGAARYYDHIQATQVPVTGRRPDRESPRPHSGVTAVAATTNHYPQPPPGISYPASQSAPGSLRNVPGVQGHVYTTHVFAPVVTGAPTKKTKYPNTANVGVPGPSVDNAQTPGAPPTAPFAATNAQGQRICRQCGMVGRYKDGKCVEKWGPGPMGPGTVCDRCRKKMKRVERRGTLESQQLAAQQQQQQQQQQFQPRVNSHAQIPVSSQGSDRPIQRSDTILTAQASLGPSTFPSKSDLAHQPSQRASHASSGAVPNKSTSRHPSPPAIAAIREQDDEEDENDPDQLPTSNVGRGTRSRKASSNTQSRSNSHNGRTVVATGNGNGNGVHTKKSSLSTASKPSVSPKLDMEVDEMDADADADAEAEAEAEILHAVDVAHPLDLESENVDGEGEADEDAELLEAVDAAEANSSSSHGGERSWMKAET